MSTARRVDDFTEPSVKAPADMDMPDWVAGLPAMNAKLQARAEVKKLELFGEMLAALESVVEADDAEEPLSNTQIAHIRNVVTRARSVNSIRPERRDLPWFLRRQST